MTARYEEGAIPLIWEMHPKSNAVVPLGRSAMVVEGATLTFYHDPGWMGEELTVDSLKRHSNVVHVSGSRNEVTLTGEVAECGDGFVKSVDIAHYAKCVVCQGTGEGNWKISAPTPEGEEQRYQKVCPRCWGQGNVFVRPDWDRDKDDAEGFKEAAMDSDELIAYHEQKYEEALATAKAKIAEKYDEALVTARAKIAEESR